ncbi:hypothetical protein MSMEI_5424 [Mycolicibacterium smegmatis MC2 155]|uniref:Uncharacterized protein n=1 Tax=Mycolicibacterium smegmatis (strain ATCC 700084 / mc(2)155) TaxID=246196 RepID=I7FKS4_MYCS2|nr:hypothetical protein MSMEI_5424 [Mycolicibacterium smegmatis MC2 155]
MMRGETVEKIGGLHRSRGIDGDGRMRRSGHTRRHRSDGHHRHGVQLSDDRRA